ncbi:MAG TPA: MazG nucleotide pyrophosphohydrolase domain-containing protein [Thermodesulfobacteriota bacterium]|nr:MazG nucleotide pyrophosphohydrolase domain-containing protein [Thermodesulfobacteriota bacterium]
MKMKKKREKVAPRSLKRREFEKDRKSVLGGVPKDVPSLSQAYQLTQKAAQVGFDWPDIEGILKKLDEEIGEFREALSLRNRSRIREEIGDLFFVLANVSRFLQINPEEALKETLKKFVSRFRYIEMALHRAGKSFPQSNLIEMDRLWEESKKKIKMRFTD